jgi:hypothetical protein
MTPQIRIELAALRLQLKSLEDNYWIRDEGSVPYKSALIGLQSLIEQPDEPAATITQTVVADDKLLELSIRLDNLGMNVSQRLTQLEAAVIQLINAAPAPAPAA